MKIMQMNVALKDCIRCLIFLDYSARETSYFESDVNCDR